MNCPACDATAGVVDSRMVGTCRRRRYQCRHCRTRFSTVEVVAELTRGGDSSKAVTNVGIEALDTETLLTELQRRFAGIG